MYIKNAILEDFGNFELDTAAIGMLSADKRNIKLPYSGALPEQDHPAKSAHIDFNIQLIQGVRLVLDVEYENRKHKRNLLAAPNDEIIALLDKFFNQEPDMKTTGLDRYWLGFWQAHYIGWKEIATRPYRLLEITHALSEEDKNYLHEHIMIPWPWETA